MQVVVFGGGGFLGSHVADALSAAGHRVTVFDLRPSVWIRDDQAMVTGSILDADAVNAAVAGADAVYNFAGIADIDEAKGRPVDTVQANVLGSTIVADACATQGVDRYLFASSVYVYSQFGSFYRASKQASELITAAYEEVHGLTYTILRYGSLYGPRSDDRNGIHRLVHAALSDKVIEYGGTGEEVRDYIHVEDAARLSVEALAPAYENEHVVLTGPQSMKIGDLLQMIAEMLGDVEIRYVEPKSSEHYTITPYSFRPRVARKLVTSSYHDLGQGVLALVGELHDALHRDADSV